MRILNPRPPNGKRPPPPPCSIAYCRLQYQTVFFLKRQIYLLDFFSMCTALSKIFIFKIVFTVNWFLQFLILHTALRIAHGWNCLMMVQRFA